MFKVVLLLILNGVLANAAPKEDKAVLQDTPFSFSLKPLTQQEVAEAVIASHFEPGAYLASLNSNPLANPSKPNSHLVYVDRHGKQIWADITKEFSISGTNRPLVEVGKQHFVAVGANEFDEGVLRIIQWGSPTLHYTYKDCGKFRTIEQAPNGELIVSTHNEVLRLDLKGTLLGRRKISESARIEAAIVTSEGTVIVATERKTCLHLQALSMDLSETQWKRNICEEGFDLSVRAMIATTDGAFVLAGRLERYIPPKNRKSDWDVYRHHAFLSGFDAKGITRFAYRTEEIERWGAMAYDSLAFAPATGEIAAVGCRPHQGFIDIFNSNGILLARGLHHPQFNSYVRSISAFPNGGDFLLGASVGHYTRGQDQFAQYQAAIGTIKR